MKVSSPVFAYREKRRYVHGTDMYSAVADALATMPIPAERGAFAMNIRRVARNQIDLIISLPGETAERPARGVADFRCDTATGVVSGWLAETDRPVSDVLPFPEQVVIDRARMTGTDIILDGGLTGFTPIQAVVALCKALHQAHRPTTNPQQWMFTRLQISSPLPGDLSRGITMTLGADGAISRASFVCGSSKGDIFFSRVAP